MMLGPSSVFSVVRRSSFLKKSSFNEQDCISAQYGYKQEDIVMLTDDARDARQQPTKTNIVCRAFICPT
jgi:hypothetical protein